MKPSSLVELAGFACLTYFAHLMYGPAAWATAGACLLFVGYGTNDAAVTRQVVDPLRRRWALNKQKRAAKKAAKTK